MSELCERLPALAENFGLRLVPAAPEDSKASATLDHTVMTPEQLCDLARAAGARVLFHRLAGNATASRDDWQPYR